jgi:hypothetical protein
MLQPTPVAPPSDTARAEIDALYTPRDEALAQLRERREDEKLRAAVEEFHRPCPPTFLRREPGAFLFRNIVTPNREFARFVATVNQTDLSPMGLEFTDDRFRASNPEKHRRCRPSFEIVPDRFRGLHLMDGSPLEGRKLGELKLKNGTALPQFHRALMRHTFPEFVRHQVDISRWFSEARRDKFYYLHYLALFIRDGILFENFLAADPEELRFAREHVIPSFTRAVELFSVRPLIVPLVPLDKESFADCERWRSYAGDLLPEAQRLSQKPPSDRRTFPSGELSSNANAAP